MDQKKKQKIDALMKEMVRRDDGKFGIMNQSDFTCVSCGARLIEGKNIHRGYHLRICKPCRMEYLDDMALETIKKSEKGSVIIWDEANGVVKDLGKPKKTKKKTNNINQKKQSLKTSDHTQIQHQSKNN